MYKVNIITSHSNNLFSHQRPSEIFLDFIFFENGSNDEEYDFIIVYEGLKEGINVKCDRRNLLFISGEPPYSRVYTKGFLKQFFHVISSHRSIVHPNSNLTQQSLPWHFGFDFEGLNYKYTYDDLVAFPLPKKTHKMSIIASNKKMMPGHNKRAKFVSKLKDRFGDEIHYFGKGVNPINDKADAILPYFMTICIENSSIDDYWTEKIADAYLGFSLPVYHGCTNISTYFPEKSYEIIDLQNTEEALNKVGWLLDNCEQIYSERKSGIIDARDLLLKKYNIYNLIVNFFQTKVLDKNTNIEYIPILPNHEFSSFKREVAYLKMKRFSKKWFV